MKGECSLQANQRRKLVIKEINEQGKVEIDQLAEQLQVSAMTIRRDLTLLEEDGRLIRTMGGAVLPKPLINETPFSTKETHHIERKKQIAKKAFQFIESEQTILLDAGTTTLELAKLIKNEHNLTVITNDIRIAAELIESKLNVIIIGGTVQNNIGTIYGAKAIEFIEEIYVDLFFLGTHAVDSYAGVTSPSLEKSILKQAMLRSAESTWLLADSSKIGEKAFSKVCDLQDITGFITDDDISLPVKTELQDDIEIL